MEFFTRLGLKVEELWRVRNYDERAFPDVATQALTDCPPHTQASLWDVVKWACLRDPLPIQLDMGSQFGQPPLTMFHGRDFHIEVLFWTTGLPGIHQHSFSGAFHVMHGSSLHALWEFEEHDKAGGRLSFGEVRLRRAEYLGTGAVRSINSGRELIHSTFHLERPSISVVVRTNNEPDSLPQYSYLPPSIAYSSHDVPPTVQRRLQILSMLVRSGRLAEFNELIRHVFEIADTFATFVYLRELWPLVENADHRDALLAAAARKHRALVEHLRPALANADRRDRIVGLRNTVDDVDLRFFLAALLNLPDRESISCLLRQKYPDEAPDAVIRKRLSELAELGILGPEFTEAWGCCGHLFVKDSSQDSLLAYPNGAPEVAAETLRSHWLLRSLRQ